MENTDTNTPNITVQDLQGLKSALEVACARGAFRAEEMQAIGTLYNNVAQFLNAIEPQLQSAPAEQPAAAEPEVAPVQGE
jgi:hypothetical protein